MSDEIKEIKVTYWTDYGGLSTAYVAELPPHAGIDKYTDEDVVLVWHEDAQEWRVAQ